MKVILVSPYSESSVGGIINWTKYVMNYYREHDRDVDLQLLNNAHAVQVMDSASFVKRLVCGLNNYLPVYRLFKKKITEEHFELAHICTSASLGLLRDLLLVRAARRKHIKTVVHMHFGRIPQILQSRSWERVLFVRLMKRVDRAVVMDRASLEALQNAGFKNVTFLPNPLSTEVQEKIEKQGEQKRDLRKIVFAGHVLETKGICELVTACREIYNIRLELLGKLPSDEFYRKITNIAGENASRWLSIPGNKPFDEVIKEMKNCGVFVLPSYSEGFPNVILESMACGCPIVATSVGAIPEMLNVDGDSPCGICVPVRDVAALRDAILELLSSPIKAKTLGDNARKRVKEMYAIPKVWGQLVDIWKDVME